MNNFLDFDLYIFDFDGVIINSEYDHYKAYKYALESLNYNIPFTWDIYIEKQHILKNGLKDYFKHLSYEKIYNIKKKYIIDNINNIHLINNFLSIYNILKDNNKNICIYTATDIKFFNIMKTKFPFLNDICILSSLNVKEKKPHIEGYIKCINKFHSKNPLIIEDSPKNYYEISKKYTTILLNTNNISINNILNKNIFNNYNEILRYTINTTNMNLDINSSALNIYSNNINNMKNIFNYNVYTILNIILEHKSDIYITGIGKNKYIAQKSVATWNSIGIKTYFIDPIECFHGSFGLIKENDIIIILSQSGNTHELINFANYIKSKAIIISITQNKYNQLSSIVDYNIVLSNNIIESDYMNMCPSSSCINFMIYLDILGYNIAKQRKYTIYDFKYNHPGGELGKISPNILDYVVIVASGQSSRLYPYTKYFPKMLLEFNGNIFLKKLIDYWSMYCSNIVIIINSQFINIIHMYLREYKNINFIIKTFDLYTGTADTIANTLKDEYFYKNILFTWSDILPLDNININNLTDYTIFTYGNSCRYRVNNNKIEKLNINKGNIIGMYYIKNYNKFNYTIGDDFCDVLNDIQINEYKLNSIIDIGDLSSYKLHNTLINTRFFNTINISNNIVTKTSVNNILLDNEKQWYIYVNNNITNINIPKLYDYSYNFINIEKINGDSLYNNLCIKNDINKIKNILDILHNNTIIISSNSILNDLKYEIVTKTINRINNIKPILDNFKYIKYVNNIEIRHIDIYKIYDILEKQFINQNMYNLIHGDCQFSNIIKDINNVLYLIDPRGYFGNTKLFGIKEYDYAKICYALTGYDTFNNDHMFYFDIINNNISINITSHIEEIEKYEWLSNKYVKYITVIIWLSLTDYIKNNPIKVVSAYYYAHYLFTKWNLYDYI